MLKRVAAVLGCLLAVSLATSACSIRTTSGSDDSAGGGGRLPASSIAAAKSRGTLIVGTAPGYLPFDMKDTKGTFIGYDMDLARAMAKSMGVKIQFKQYDFAALIPALKQGSVDVAIAGFTITGERALEISFSQPYYAAGQSMLVPSSDGSTKSWRDLDKAGKRIGVSQGTTGAMLAHKLFRHATVADYENLPGSTLALTQKKVDAVIYDEPGLRIYAKQNPSAVRGIWDRISTENLGIVLKHNDVASVQWVNSFLDSYLDSGDEKASRQKWFDSVAWFDQVQKQK
ncbi:transporter substrate-binding domain-containing protein [Actinocatenispora rupis]|uniref:ABC transporter n=1 Tax=Actinocatenispora rupis TaxID=519421 RepID=A0A8J3JFX8_9ACTN|nr:transporter substrate-binding domain-containing protein [Actinocatenispora rupis]GID15954.1 ABC transporter [Actinocatenispora rupis]